MKDYTVLGVHGPDVTTVRNNVVRVRMIVGNQMIDEDFELPRVITVEEQIDAAVQARIAEIKTKGTDPAASTIIPAQDEQVVVEVPNV